RPPALRLRFPQGSVNARAGNRNQGNSERDDEALRSAANGAAVRLDIEPGVRDGFRNPALVLLADGQNRKPHQPGAEKAAPYQRFLHACMSLARSVADAVNRSFQ